MKTSFKKIISVLLALTLIFGTAAFGLSDVDWSELAVFANAERKSTLNNNALNYAFSGNVLTPTDAATPAEPLKTQTGKCGENVFWTFYEDTGLLVISGSGDMYNYTESLTNHFSNLWKGFRDKIEEVVIEYGVTSIGDFVFACCSLKKITIPNTVKRIGDEAFIMCALLSEVKIPSSVESIGYYAFTSCESLKEFSVDGESRYFSNDGEGVLFDLYMSTLICYPAGKSNTTYKIPYGVKTIKTAAFFECTSLEEIVFNYSLTEIQGAAFMNCAGLKELNLPESLIIIGEEAFCNCVALESVSVPENVEVIDMLAFNNCLKLKSITIPDGVEKIGYVSFDNTEFYDNENNWENGDLYIGSHLIDTKNTDAETYTIKSGTKVISDCVLGKLHSKTIIIPESVTNIGGHSWETFGTPTNVERFIVDENNKFYSNDAWGVLYNKDKTELVIYPAGKTETSFVVPDSVVSIADYAFYGCDELSDIHIPDSVEKIGNRALDSTGFFKDESNWENGVLYAGKCLVSAKKDISGKYVVKYGTKYICCCAFQACKNLTEIIIPNGVEEIGAGAFSGCSSLEEIILPEGVKKLGFALFENCENLCRVHIPSTVAEISSEFIPFYFSVNYGNPHCFMLSSPSAFICSHYYGGVVASNSFIATFARENGIKFESCRNRNYKYQDGYAYVVENHGNTAIIMGCGETINGDVIIPTELGGYPVTSIENDAFNLCSNITSITIHKNIIHIDIGLCYGLQSIKVDPDNPLYSNDENGILFNKDKSELVLYPIGKTQTSYEIPDTVKRIGNGAFLSLKEVDYIFLPSGYLKNIIIPNSVTEIGSGAFAWSNIENIVVPDSVENIKNGAFQGCINLETVTIGKGLSSIGREVFLLCKSLERITVDEENKNFSNDENGILFNKDKTVLIKCPNSIKLEQYIIPDTVEEIGSEAFQTCSNLKQVILQDGIKTIDRYAFEGCANLEDVYIPKSVTAIRTDSFRGCDKLKNIYYEGTREDWSSIEQYQYGLIDENLVRFSSSIDDLPELPEKTPDEEPTTKPTTTKPVEVPTTSKPIVTEPSTTKPAEVPTTAKPIVTEPSTTKPAEVPTTAKPIVTEPSTTKPAEVPTTAKPIVTEPSTTKPVEAPTTSKPVATEPSTTKPVEAPTTSKPVATEPSTTKPVEVPTTSKPIVTEPSTTKPAEVPTTTKPIVTEPSTTKPAEVPTTAKPTTTEPTTVPTTQPTAEKKVTVEIRKPSQTEIVYGDSIVLHADVENMPEGAKVIWTADNGNFTITSSSENGRTCAVTPAASGDTVFVATLIDADGNTVASDTQTMTAKAGFFQKIIAFFKKIFGLTKIIPETFEF